MKRRLSVLLAVVVLLAAVVLLAPSAAAETTGEFRTIMQNDKLYITGYSGTLPSELVIPEEIDGVPVYGMTAIYGWTWNTGTITSVVLPDSMQDIPENAFRYCSNLQSIHIGAGISKISGYSFEWTSVSNITVSENSSYYTVIDGVLYDKAVENMIYCPLSNEDSHQIPATVKSFPIGQQWLPNFHMRPTLTVEAGSPYFVCENDVLYTADRTTVVYCNSSYSGAYIMPDTVTSMDQYAFQGCTNLESVTISNSVTAISYGAFENCTALQTVTIPPSVTSIDLGGFANCTELEQVHISDIAAWCGITMSWGESNPLYYAGNLYLNGKLVTDLVLPESVTTVKASTFANTACLTSVTGSANLKSIEWRAFESCTNLKEITLPDTVTSIGDCCFAYCNNLSKVRLSQGLTEINYGVFYGCVSLTAITIPDSVQYISTDAFYYCTSLKQINLPKEVGFGIDVFGNCPLDETFLPQGTTDTSPYLFSNAAFQEFSIPNTVNTLCYNSFYSCDNLKNVGIPLSVTTIEDYAFEETDNLENVYYEGSLQQWDQIEIGDGNSPLTNAMLHTNYDFPKITKQPVSYKATGNTATFTVTATGNIAAYQWQYRPSSWDTWTNVSGASANAAKLSLPVTPAQSGYQYRCIVTDQVGLKAFSEAATLTTPDLMITALPENQYVPVGKTAKFTVKVLGEGLTYQWQYRTSAKDSWKNETATGSKTATLSVAVTAARNGYQYRCVITNQAGDMVTSNAATLTVVTLKVTAQPAGANLPAGKTAKFTVKATGTGLKYQWQYRTSSKGSWKNETASGSKTATLSVPVTAIRNGYQYRCVIADKYGNVVNSNAATLKVVILKVTTQPANKYLPAGKTAKFTVKVSGTGLKYQWQYRKNAKGTWKNASGTGNKKATLSVAATAARNGYQYRCKITDKYGNVIYSKVATLKIVTLKITAQPSSVTLAKGKTATFKVVAKGTGLKYQWQFRKNAQGAWKKATNKGNKTATLKVPVTNARNGYQYRCVITDKYGNVINSAAATLKVKK